MKDVALTCMVLAMMTSVGLDLTLSDLRAGLQSVRAVVIAVLLNLVVVPVGVLLASRGLGLSEGLVTGLVLCAAAPGGATGPAFARIAGGALGFATALMALLGGIGLVSAPLTVTLLLGGQGGATLFWPMLTTLATVQLLPLALAMTARATWPRARGLARPAGLVANVLLVTIIVALLATRGDALLAVPVALHVLIVGMLVGGILLALRLPVGEGAARSIAMVTAVRNLSIALLLTARFVPDPEADVAVLVCGFWMMLLPAGLAAITGRARG